MKAIILAAGEGTRLRPLTNDIPKCMVQANGKALVEYQLDVYHTCNIHDITIIKGYKQEALVYPNIKYYINHEFATTNMVYSLFCAEDEMNDDIIISYGDIVYTPEVLQTLISNPSPFCLSIDKEWFKLWSARMDDPLSDAETLKLDSENNIIELGKKPSSLSDIEGQYMGLIKISKEILPEVKSFYHTLDPNGIYDGKPKNKMFFTTFLQMMIDSGFPIKASIIHGGWIEVDAPSDLELFNQFITIES